LIVTLPQHEDKPAVIQIPLGRILSLEVGTILLSAWFDCNWINAGQEEKFHIYFNTVSRSLFEALCHSIRQTINPSTQTAMPADQKHLERLNHLPYKFKNLIPLRLLLPGEQIRAAVYRPAMWNKRLFRLPRCLASQMAVVLTNSFLIVTQEQVINEENGQGLMPQFYPLNYLRCAGIDQTPNGLELALQFNLDRHDYALRLPFPLEAQPVLKEAFKDWQ
jgi:hypothetical protein